jgi:repressor LexA
MRPFTEPEIIEYLREHRDTRGYAPSTREICKEFGIRSTSTVYTRLERLRAKGILTWEYGKQRTLRLL